MTISTLPWKMPSRIALQSGAGRRTAGDFLALLGTRSSGLVVLQGARNKIHGNLLITLTPVLAVVRAEVAGGVEGVEEGVEEGQPEAEGGAGEVAVVLEADTLLKDWASQGEWRPNDIICYEYPQFQNILTTPSTLLHNIILHKMKDESIVSVSATRELSLLLRLWMA
jgi:hypothetical protein